MASTKYTVQSVDAAGVTTDVDTKSEKARAVAIAETLRGTDKVGVRVVTGTGTVVFELAAPSGKRVIVNKTKPYARVDTREPVLAEGIALPDGYELTYLLPRNKISVLRDPESLEYLVFDHLTGNSEVATSCRHAAQVVKEIKAVRAKAQAKQLAKASA